MIPSRSLTAGKIGQRANWFIKFDWVAQYPSQYYLL